ncbi:BMC domain-containing protein [uncultured Megasphaera sp.]|jgi:hypothetical protein|nr:BMC domain-containing protein [uncultured Megasphaera sp.]
MGKALGLIEVIGFSTAVEVADAMIKSADVILIGVEITKGNGFVTIKVSGDVGAVNAAVETGKAVADLFGKFISADSIARPHEAMHYVFIEKEKKIKGRTEPLDIEQREEETSIYEGAVPSGEMEEGNSTSLKSDELHSDVSEIGNEDTEKKVNNKVRKSRTKRTKQ